MKRLDRWVLTAIEALVLCLPLFLGGRDPGAIAVGAIVILTLLCVTVVERRRREGSPSVPGLWVLAAFLALAMLTVVPLPPGLLRRLSPATARLYGLALPGWPDGGEWSAWRPLALSPYDVFSTLTRFSVAIGTYGVVAGFPWSLAPEDWEGEAPRAVVLDRLIATILLGGVAMAALGLVQSAFGNGWVMWLSEEPSMVGRMAGPFVNPNHYAAWLEMVIPIGFAFVLTMAARLTRRVARTARSGRGMGVRSRRAWASALVIHQRMLWPPIAATLALAIMISAHGATDSRGGRFALLVGLAVSGLGTVYKVGDAFSRSRTGRVIGMLIAALPLVGVPLVLLAWIRASGEVATSGLDGSVDLSLAARLAASRLGARLLRDFPLFGVGLGSWLDAFRPYQAPPLEGGILDHAHNDYLEIFVETGFVGGLLVMGFAASLVWFVLRQRVGSRGSRSLQAREHPPGSHRHPAGFELPEWRLAIRDHHLLRWGMAGGVAAILAHSFLDFGLRLPANLLLLFFLLALIVLSVGPPDAGRAPGLAVMVAVFAIAAWPQARNWIATMRDDDPVSPRSRVDRAEFLLAEEPEEGWTRAVELLKGAIDGAPALIEAHEMLAQALGPGPGAIEAMRRAVSLQPWAVQRRDELAMMLFEEGIPEDAADEIAEGMFQYPSLDVHAYFYRAAPPEKVENPRLSDTLRILDHPTTTTARIKSMDPVLAGGIERGLRRALSEGRTGIPREHVLMELSAFLEARDEMRKAGELLLSEGQSLEDPGYLMRAASDFIAAGDVADGERALLSALVLDPSEALLYQSLATEIYGPRGDFESADAILAAGRRNATDQLPLDRSMSSLLTLRRSAERAKESPSAVSASSRDSLPGEDEPGGKAGGKP